MFSKKKAIWLLFQHRFFYVSIPNLHTDVAIRIKSMLRLKTFKSKFRLLFSRLPIVIRMKRENAKSHFVIKSRKKNPAQGYIFQQAHQRDFMLDDGQLPITLSEI